MNNNQFIAPDFYNLTEEIDRYKSDKIALLWESESGIRKEMTYEQLINQGNRLANVLLSLGLEKGDRVMVMVPRLLEAYVIYYACLKAGLVIIPASEMLRAKDIHYRLEHSQAKAVLSFADFCTEMDEIAGLGQMVDYKLSFGHHVEGWVDIEELMSKESPSFDGIVTSRDDMAFLSYTSGTTGHPKGVVHSHGWAFAHLRIAAEKWLNIGESDLVWATAGPGWQKWVWSPFLSILGKGATGFIYHGRFQPHKYLQILQEKAINVLCCTPTEYRMMATVDDLGQFDLSHLHSAVSAGEALNREVIDTFKKTFNLDIRDGYGQTESTLLIGHLKGLKCKSGSMGKPIARDYIDIVDVEGKPVPVGEVGTIAIRRDFPALFKRYYKDPEKTAASCKGEYFLTGDRAYRDGDGDFWYQGRNDDIIISSGYTIGPFEVEEALMTHESVQECAVVASPDRIRGHVVKAFIVLKNGIQEGIHLRQELQKHVKKLTAPYKYPRIIEFVKSLPKTDSGKIRRVELRKLKMDL